MVKKIVKRAIAAAGAACEQLVLFVGPKAAVSDYVRQEWYVALHADKAATRSCGKAIIPWFPMS